LPKDRTVSAIVEYARLVDRDTSKQARDTTLFESICAGFISGLSGRSQELRTLGAGLGISSALRLLKFAEDVASTHHAILEVRSRLTLESQGLLEVKRNE